MLYTAAMAGMFSSLSANIYFPALGLISRVGESPSVSTCANVYIRKSTSACQSSVLRLPYI